jgi:DNA-binding transcriptional LysR family regulator
MRFTHAGEADLNLLVPLSILLEERHVSRAAVRCGLSQPAMSRALERLRATFRDELLVRANGRFERTARGDRLLVELHDLLPRLETTLRGDAFDPSTSRHMVRIAATEYASSILVPSLVRQLFSVAPLMQASVVSWNTSGVKDVESGHVDLALVGEQDCLPLESEQLFSDDFVCLVSHSHPFAAKRMTMKSFVAYPHVDIAVTDGRNPYLENALGAHGVRRRVRFRTPFPISAVLATAASDMIYTTPRRNAAILQSISGVRIVEAPKELTNFTYVMAWHSRMRTDVVQSWLRLLVKRVARQI